MTLPNFSPGMTFDDFVKAVNYNVNIMLDWRYGQALFNTLAMYRPDIAESIRGKYGDPFYVEDANDIRVIVAWTAIEERW